MAVTAVRLVTSFAFPGTAQPSLHGVPTHHHLLFSGTKLIFNIIMTALHLTYGIIFTYIILHLKLALL